MATYASLLERAGALMVDTIVVYVLSFVMVFMLGIMMVMGGIDVESTAATALVYLIAFCTLLLYFTILEGPLGGGQTIGKRLINIKVTTEEGNVPSYGAAIIRNILRIIDGLFLYLVGVMIIRGSDKNQRLGDKTVKTIVVKAGELEYLPMKRIVMVSMIFIYGIGLLIVELLVTYSQFLKFGIIGYGILFMFVISMVILAIRHNENDFSRLALSLTILPWVRIVSLSTPTIVVLNPIYHILLGGILVFNLALLVIICAKMTLKDLGLVMGNFKIQVMIAMTGFIFGVIEYFILKEYIAPIEIISFWVILIQVISLFTGFVEKLVFMGMVLTNAERILGRLIGLIFVSVLFAIMHIGWGSPLDLIFVFGVALFYGYVFLKTRSLLGIIVSSGITNIMLFLVMPIIYSS